MGRNVLGNNALVLSDVGSEEVVLEGKAFVEWGHLWHVDQRQTGLVVLKDSSRRAQGSWKGLGD